MPAHAMGRAALDVSLHPQDTRSTAVLLWHDSLGLWPRLPTRACQRPSILPRAGQPRPLPRGTSAGARGAHAGAGVM